MIGANGHGNRDHAPKGVVVWWCVRCLGSFTAPGHPERPNRYAARLALRSRDRFGACPNCRAWARAHLDTLRVEGAAVLEGRR